MKFPALLAAMALASLCTSVHAQWKELATAPVGKISYDLASVRVQGGKTELQYRMDFTNPVTDPATKKSVGSSLMKVAIDCKAKTVTLLSVETYPAAQGKGTLLDRTLVKAPTAEVVAEHSSNALLYDAACKSSAPAAAPAPAPTAPAPAKPAAPKK